MGFDIGKWFTLPKSKSPWDAATLGSTGGWAKPFNKFGPLITAASGAIPTFGPFISTGMGAIGAVGKGSGFQGTDYGWKNAWTTPLGALQGYGLGSLGAGAAGGIKGLASGTGLMSGAKAGMGNYFGTNIIPGVSGSNPTSWFGGANAIPTKTGSIMQPLYGGSPAATGASYSPLVGYSSTTPNFMPAGVTNSVSSIMTPNTTSASTATTSSLDNIFKGVNPYQLAAGVGISSIPSLMGGKTPQMPQSDLFGQATSRLMGGKGITELGQLGQEQLRGQLAGQFQPVPDAFYDASTRRLNESYDKAERDFGTNYKGLRPGANVENDTAFQTGINKIRQDRARETSALAADLDYRREMDYYDRKMNAINSSLNLDQQTMSDYIALAQMDSTRLANNLSISIGEATKFKEIFGDLGGLFMRKGMGIENPDSVILRMMSKIGV